MIYAYINDDDLSGVYKLKRDELNNLHWEYVEYTSVLWMHKADAIKKYHCTYDLIRSRNQYKDESGTTHVFILSELA